MRQRNSHWGVASWTIQNSVPFFLRFRLKVNWNSCKTLPKKVILEISWTLVTQPFWSLCAFSNSLRTCWDGTIVVWSKGYNRIVCVPIVNWFCLTQKRYLQSDTGQICAMKGSQKGGAGGLGFLALMPLRSICNLEFTSLICLSF